MVILVHVAQEDHLERPENVLDALLAVLAVPEPARQLTPRALPSVEQDVLLRVVLPFPGQVQQGPADVAVLARDCAACPERRDRQRALGRRRRSIAASRAVGLLLRHRLSRRLGLVDESGPGLGRALLDFGRFFWTFEASSFDVGLC